MTSPQVVQHEVRPPVRFVPTKGTVNRLVAKRRRKAWESQAQKGAADFWGYEITASTEDGRAIRYAP